MPGYRSPTFRWDTMEEVRSFLEEFATNSTLRNIMLVLHANEVLTSRQIAHFDSTVDNEEKRDESLTGTDLNLIGSILAKCVNWGLVIHYSGEYCLTEAGKSLMVGVVTAQELIDK